ncbi:hypothetical protein [Vibrio owensii]|uniref:hypothetical protein n=1 Tax=Vibrio owensii TaxID=696485 RepID=UPI0038CDE495
MSSTIDPKLIAKLSDPEVQAQLAALLQKQEESAPSEFAPFYRNVHGKISKGNANMERYRSDLGLTPIHEEEAIELGLLKKVNAVKAKVAKNPLPAPSPDNTDEEALKALRLEAKAAGIPNWQVKGAARLRGELTKIKLKAESQAHDTGSDDS